MELLTERGQQNCEAANSETKTLTNPQERPPINRIVSYITGGLSISGVSSSSTKRHWHSLKHSVVHPSRIEECEMAEISFLSEDARTLVLPHHDALVITTLIVLRRS